MGGAGCLACRGLLDREACVGVLVGGAGFFLSASFVWTILSSTSLILSSASVILLLVPSRVLWSQLVHYSLLIDSFLFLLDPC